MSTDLTPSKPHEPIIEGPLVGGFDAPLSEAAKQRIRQPIIAGGLVIAVCVVGVAIWAAVSPIWGAVIAPGAVRVEFNRKTLKSREGGVVRAIHVHDGDAVRQDQLLLQFDDVVPKAQVTVLTNQRDALLAQNARFTAEATNRRIMTFAPELQARASDPRVAALMQNEQFLFTSRLTAVEGQADILNQRVIQLNERLGGLQVQVDSIDEQTKLYVEELQGYQKLYEKGFAPKTLLLRLERQLSANKGQRGSLTSDITRTKEQVGETRLQLASLYQQRASEAAEGKGKAESQLADVSPRLDAAVETLTHTDVRSPVAGYVLNLSQFTIGGVAGAGEPLMDVVPSNTPLVVSARIKPNDIDEVAPGMRAEVGLSAYNSRKVPKVEATVISVSADALSDAKSGESFFTTELRIDPAEMKKLPKGVKLYPGMQASVMIQTGKRTIMSYLLGPIGDMFHKALRED